MNLVRSGRFVLVIRGIFSVVLWAILLVYLYAGVSQRSQFWLQVAGLALVVMLIFWWIALLYLRFVRVQDYPLQRRKLRLDIRGRLFRLLLPSVVRLLWYRARLWQRERRQWLREGQLAERDRTPHLPVWIPSALLLVEMLIVLALLARLLATLPWEWNQAGAIAIVVFVIVEVGLATIWFALTPSWRFGSGSHWQPGTALLGIVVILFLANYEANPGQVWGELDQIGIPTALSSFVVRSWKTLLVLSGIALVFWPMVVLYSRRPRHILEAVSFQATEQGGDLQREGPDGGSQFVQLVAEELTTQFSAQLQRITWLLSLRQEETRTPVSGPLKSAGEGQFTLFVTSGVEDPLFTQLDTISDYEVSGVRFPRIGTLLNLILRIRAALYIKVRVHAGSHGNFEARLEVANRVQRTTTILTASFLVGHSESTQVMAHVKAAAEELALKTVLFLGERHELASSWRGLQLFVAALEASRRRNWWLAIANYQQVTAMEEGQRGSYPIGQYHIGSTLLLQGEPESALQYLLKAASSGPVRAETYYMLAVNLHALSQGQLAERQFELITGYLRDAISAREDFVEAKHLLGLVYYQRYKNLSAAEDPPTDEMRRNLEIAQFILADAHRTYEARIARLARKGAWFAALKPGDSRQAQEYLMVAHHWADTLRSLEAYDLALLLYKDTEEVFPASPRNLADTLRTLNRAENWDGAKALVDGRIASYPTILWSAVTQLYYGVALARSLAGERQADVGTPTGFAQFDFAVYLRPQFIEQRDQTNWLDAWKAVQTVWTPLPATPPAIAAEAKTSIQKALWANLFTATEDKTRLTIDDFGIGCGLWLSLRLCLQLDSLPASDAAQSLTEKLRGSWTMAWADDSLREIIIGGEARGVDFIEHWGAYRQLGDFRRQSAEILYSSDMDNLRQDARSFAKLANLAWEIRQSWESLNDIWDPRLSHADGLFGKKFEHCTLAWRWELDTFLQLSMLLCSKLAMCRDFAGLLTVAEASYRVASAWRDRWAEALRETIHRAGATDIFRFSSPVFRYQLVSLQAWVALAKLRVQRAGDDEMSGAGNAYALTRERLHTLRELQKTAVQYNLAQHPLSLFVQAQYYRSCGMYFEAMGKLSQVLDANADFEGDQFNPFEYTFNALREDRPQSIKEFKDAALPVQLLYLERVAGQQQFGYFVNPARVYAELAEVAERIGDLPSSVQHLFSALAWSRYTDYDLQNFTRLTQQLIKNDQFDAALATVKEAQTRLIDFPRDSLRTSSMITFDVLECSLLARLGHYEEAIRRGDLLLAVDERERRSAASEEFVVFAELIKKRDELGKQLGKQPIVLRLITLLRKRHVPQDEHSSTQEMHRSRFASAQKAQEAVLAQRMKAMVDSCLDTPPHVPWTNLLALFNELMTQLKTQMKGPLDTATVLETVSLIKATKRQNSRVSDVLAKLQAETTGDRKTQVDQYEQMLEFATNHLRQKPAQPDRHADSVSEVGMRFLQFQYFIERIERGMFFAMYQACDLYNTVAFSRAALEQNLDEAIRRSLVAIMMMQALRGKEGQGHSESDATLRAQIDERLAQYYDTLAWALFHRRQHPKPDLLQSLSPAFVTKLIEDGTKRPLSDLDLAVKILEDFALPYNQELPILHHHLSQVYLALTEEAWQDQQQGDRKRQAPEPAEFRAWLHKASSHWQFAKSLDKSGRLDADLRYLNKRLETMIADWRTSLGSTATVAGT